MPLREDILKPIPGDNPSGVNLRSAPVYDKIKEARREDDQLPQGAWQHERKTADYGLVIKLAQEAIAVQSKDLQLAAWLTEALVKQQGMRGLREGLVLCDNMINQFWDTLYPEMEDGDLEMRSGPIEFITARLVTPVKGLALSEAGYTYFQYVQSRSVQYEDQAKTKEEKSAREKALKEGKLAPELFDKSFVETPKAFYFQMEKQIDETLGVVPALDKTCQEKFADSGPSFGKLKEGIQEVRQVVHSLLQKKRETEPDPVEVVEAPPSEEAVEGAPGEEAAGSGGGGDLQSFVIGRAPAEPAERREAIANVAAAAALLRKREPFSPAPYLMLRGLRWGELRASSDPAILEAPPGDLRQQIKSLAMRSKWRELLELSESIMALPCSRAWLDLQRFAVEACVGLGDNYSAIAIAIRSGLRGVLQDLPHLLEATLSDDTPVANHQTQAWLRELLAEPGSAAPQNGSGRAPVMDKRDAPGWQKKFVDANALALEAMRAKDPQKAIAILQTEIERQLSGRGRFQRKLQLAQICIAAGKDAIAQPLLDDLAAIVELHKLEEWEDRETVAGALTFLLQHSKKIQADAKAKQTIFERICRLDPVQALGM